MASRKHKKPETSKPCWAEEVKLVIYFMLIMQITPRKSILPAFTLSNTATNNAKYNFTLESVKAGEADQKSNNNYQRTRSILEDSCLLFGQRR